MPIFAPPSGTFTNLYTILLSPLDNNHQDYSIQNREVVGLIVFLCYLFSLPIYQVPIYQLSNVPNKLHRWNDILRTYMKENIYSRNAVYETLRAKRRQPIRLLMAENIQEKGRL